MKKTNSKFLFGKWKLWMYAMLCMTFSSFSEYAQAQVCDLVVNGNFAAAHACPQTGFTYDYNCDPARPIAGPGNIAVTNNARLWNGPWSGTSRLADGTNFLIADGANMGNSRIWRQSVNVVAGTQYTFTAWARNIVNPASLVDRTLPSVSIHANGLVLATTAPLAQAAPNVWTRVSAVYTATVTGALPIDIRQNVIGGYDDVAIDDISFTVIVPRPNVADVNICSGTSATLTVMNPVAGTIYEWYTVAAGGAFVNRGITFITPVLNINTSYFVEAVTANGCRSQRRRVRVTVNPLPNALRVANATICGPGTAILRANGPIPRRTFWYTNAADAVPFFRGNPFITPVLNANTSYWVSTINPATGCESVRTRVDVTVNPTPILVGSNVTLCQGAIATLTETPAATAGTTVRWYSGAMSVGALHTGTPFITPAINASTTYWVSVTSAQGCTSDRAPVNINVNPLPQIPAVTDASRCGCGTLDLTASGSTGNFNWYAAQNGGAPISNATTFTTPVLCNSADYWVSAVSAAGCESPRVRSSATITTPVATNLVTNGNFAAPNSCPEVGFTHPGYTCANAPGGGTLVVTSNAALINGPWWGVDRLGGSNFLAIDGAGAPNAVWVQNVNVVAGTTYTYSVWVRNLVNPGSGAGVEGTNPSVSIRVNGVVLANSGPIAQSPANAWRQIVVAYTAPATGAITLDVMHNVGGSYNDIGVDDISFTAIAPTPAVIDVNICSGNTATLTATGATAGYTYVWYAAAAGGNPLATNTNPYVTPVLTANTTYWVTLRDANGCEGDRIPANVIIRTNSLAPIVADANRCDCGVLTLTATGTDTYNWYDAAANGTLLGTGNDFTTPSICSTTTYFVSATDVNGCVSTMGTATASITGAAVTIAGPTQVYANGIINYELVISNNSGVDMNNITINTSLADFVLDNTINPNPYPVGPYAILAGGAPITVTYRGYFPSSGGVPKTICFDILANGCTTQVCKTITNIYAGCPFAWGAPSSDCDTETYGANGVIKTMSLSGHNNFFDINKIDFNLTYNPSLLELVSTDVVADAPAGSTVSTTSVSNTDGTITINGTVNYGSNIDILHSNGDGDVVIYNIVDLGFRILARPLTTCDLQLPTTGTTFYTATTSLKRPTDYGRIVFLCTPCPAISAFFTASPNPVLQGATITFTANPIGGAHSWYSGINNNRQMGSTSPTAMYVYNAPGVFTVTHYRTENGLTGIYSENIEVCGILTDSIDIEACTGTTINVPFTASACSGFQNNNVFSLELSDAAGVFSNNNPTIIGTWAGNTSGNITGTIPGNAIAGSGCRVRILSSSPVLRGTDNGVNLTVSNCNSGLTFDGADDRVTVPTHAAYAIGAGDFTMEGLVNIPVGVAGRIPLFSKRTSGTDGFLMYISATQILLQMSGVPNYLSGGFANIADGNCHHIAITRSGSLITFYVDGNSVGTVNSTRSLNSTGPLHIGYDSPDASSFNGAINEARLWNVARTQAEIASNATVTLNAASAGLIGLWKFNEVNTQTVTDASATANNGFLGNNIAADANDPIRNVVTCYSGDRHDAQNIDKVYSATGNWGIQVAPNPFVNETSISIQSTSELSDNFHVEIYSMDGQLLKAVDLSMNSNLVLGNELKAGLYIVKARSNGVTQTAQMIKQ